MNETLHSLSLIYNYKDLFLLHNLSSYIPNIVTQRQKNFAVLGMGSFLEAKINSNFVNHIKCLRSQIQLPMSVFFSISCPKEVMIMSETVRKCSLQ